MPIAAGFALSEGEIDHRPQHQCTRRDKIRLLGNGVCAPVMTAIVRSLLDSAGTAVPLMAAE